MIIGEAGGGATGDRQDWLTLPHRESKALSRYGRGRTGVGLHRVTIFYGGGKVGRPPDRAHNYPSAKDNACASLPWTPFSNRNQWR